MSDITTPKPWLTIVTVNRDDLAGLSRTLLSVSIQDLSGVEHIIIDSSHNPVTKSDAGKNMTSLHHYTIEWTPAVGVYAAMNLGIRRSHGEYILFLNSGDIFHSRFVVNHLRRSIEMSKHVWFYGKVEKINRSGSRQSQKEFDFDEEFARRFRAGRFPQQPGMLVNTKLMRDLLGFNEEYRIAGDYELMLRLSRLTKPLELNFTVTDFEIGGVSTTNWRQSLTEARIAREKVYELGFGARSIERLLSVPVFLKSCFYHLFLRRVKEFKFKLYFLN